MKKIQTSFLNLALAAFCVASVFTSAVSRAVAADDPAGLEFFEKKIRPILVDNCYPCHSKESGKSKGNLLVDSRDDLLKGGDTGPALKPGDADQSLLIKAVQYSDENLQMPPKNKKLSGNQIANLIAWIKMGAPDPRVAVGGVPTLAKIWEQASNHWAFQPVKPPPIPAVKNKRDVRTPVDNFILAKLDAAGLQPSPQADKRTLIRRATFDLIGLPPTPEEVAAFVADRSPDAFAHVVDRLLASPHYGERWGRHWLDVARYADTKGYVFEEDRHYPYSYTYRDYVIRSFNEDLPYDQFIKQQIAADLMPLGEDKRPLAALGFLTLGRRFVNNINDIIDDRIDVVCRGTMGLTVACARCHDHKYDPIPTQDYYSLYGVFASSMEPEEEPLIGGTVPEKLRVAYEAEHKKRQAVLDNYKKEKKEEMLASIRAATGNYLLAAHETKLLSDASARDEVAHKYKLHPEVLHGWRAALKNWREETNAIFVPWFAFSALSDQEFATKAKGLAEKFSANRDGQVNPLVAKAFMGNPPASIKEVSERYNQLFAQIDQEWHQAQAATNVINATKPAKLLDAAKESLREILYADGSPANVAEAELHHLYETSVQQQVRTLRRSVAELDATDLGAPPRATALVDVPEPHDVNVFVRGNGGNPGPVAPREFLKLLSPPDRKPFQQGSGRLELADDIASTNNPLTARVFVNRVWLHHFGAALVATPSDFGLRSDPPVNQQLLDYLAARFMADGWSIKKLHRLIMLSATYQQSSADNAEFAKVDPGNQLLWRMNRQRLEFEAMRDTLLDVSGKLDLAEGGHAVEITDAHATRRSVYGFIDRQNLPEMFRTFDFASPDTSSARRFYTSVPQQALFLMNSPFLIQQAKNFVERPDFTNAANDTQRLELLYETAFQRKPTAEETLLAHQFIESQINPPTTSDSGPNWLFGYGSFDENSKRTKTFHKLPFFDGRAFQGGPTLPDKKLGWVVVSGTGGHPGNDQKHAAIRRWIAPRGGIIKITGELFHPDAQGDGVRGRIVSSETGLLATWSVKNRKQPTEVENVSVKEGDKIDFVTDCQGNPDFDAFTWSPTIRFMANGKTLPNQRMEWNALADFTEAAEGMHPPLDAWQKYAQVLLLTNELIFVD